MQKLNPLSWALAVILALGVSMPLSAGSPGSILAVKGGRFFTGTGGIIEGGILLIREGKIVAFGKDVAIPNGAKVIDAASGFIMPGLIDAFTNLGTEEPGTLGSDSDEGTSPVTPQLRIIDSFSPQNPFIPLARKAGVTAALVAPAVGNLIAGQCGLMSLWGDDAAAMTIRFPAAMQAALGEAPKMRFGPKNEMPQTRMGEAALLRQTLVDVQDYLRQIGDYERKSQEFKAKKADGKNPEEAEPQPPAADPKLQALIPVLKGEIPLLITANRLDDILTALRIADEFGLKIILSGGADAYRVGDKLAARKIPVLLKPGETSDRLTLETQQAVPENAALLFRAGVKIAFETGSVKDVGGLVRQAQLAFANGLPREEALRALTLNPAEIFGVAAELGSLEKGKTGSLTIFEGDPLLAVAKVRAVVVRGEIAD
jgi:imidazolonepropionase-like amidohydrolase